MRIRGIAHIGAEVIRLVTMAGMLGACGGQSASLATNTGSDGGQSGGGEAGNTATNAGNDGGYGGAHGPGVAWARSVVSGQASADFLSVAADGSNNVYVAGDLWGPGSFDFGNGVTPTSIAKYYDPLLIKYDASGVAQWAQTAAGSNESQFLSVAVDLSGEIYAAGYVRGSQGPSDFNNGVTVTSSDTFTGAILVKYNASGLAQWARAVANGSNDSSFQSVTVDPSGNVYVGGWVNGTGTYNFGNGVTVTGVAIAAGASGANPPQNAVVAKYDASGAAQWAQSVIAGSPESSFDSVVVDAVGNLYAAGTISGTGTYDFGNGITVNGGPTITPLYGLVGANALLVKYSSSGIALWARSPAGAPGGSGSDFRSVAVDSTGNAYAAGSIGDTPYDFGNGVIAAATGGSQMGLCCGPLYVVLAKYDASGVALWAKTVSPGGSNSYLVSVTVDSSGNAYVAGNVYSPGTYNFGNGVAVGTGGTGYHGALVRYDAAGMAQWARSSANGGASEDSFLSAALGSTGKVYVAGLIAGPGVVDFGNNVTIMARRVDDAGPGWNGWSPLLVKYQ